ncbi:M4 family metallopeptidase [Kitasatospora azatica]|uniref:M4 family metallopeptidase n=1 Tax=Kitasatospora azatica TaxID=58347 RepID=UPI000A8CBA93|nr:M4 family metallopeptidase [Kitasatospora azatica]
MHTHARNSRRRPSRSGTAALAAAGLLIAGLAAAGTSAAVPPPAPESPQALAVQNADALVASRPAFLHAGANEQFTHRQVASSGGTQYVPYERTYSGVPVVGGDFVIVTNSAGQVLSNSVAQEHSIGTLSVSPTLSSAKAESVASAQLKSVSKVEGTRLVVYALGAAPAALAWESTVDGTGDDGYSRLSVDVDARTGAVLHTQEHVMHGSGTGAWNGPAPLTINTTSSGGTFSMSPTNITNMPCQDAATNTTFTKSTDTWGNGDATNKETGCVDAEYVAQGEFRMLSQWLGRNGMDGSGGAWPIRVGLADVNAYYDGSQVQVGHNDANQWISAVDVLAHEMGHGIDDHTPGGISGNGTQEFVADVYGASTEFFINEPSPYAVPDFLVGDQVNLVGTGPIRNMYNPSLINNDPNCYSSSIPNAEVHSAAGPGNHWFYLLAQGSNPAGGPTSPTCNSSTVTGIGVQNALKILYNAQLMKTSASSYLMYRTWTLRAAKTLDPSCAQFNTVKAAWDAVSVPAQSGDPTCTVGNDFSIAVSPGSGAVNPGSSLTTTVATTLTNGSTQTVNLSASGLPTGATASFNPASVSAGGTSQLTIGTATSTPAGTYTVTVTGAGASTTHTTTFSLTVNGTGGSGISNGGFESGNLSGWTTSGASATVVNSGAHSGTYAARLGSTAATNGDANAAQTFTAPSGTGTLSFWYNVTCPDTVSYDWATATLADNTAGTSTTVLAKTCVANSGWKQASAPVTAGHSYTLTLTSHDDNYSGDPTYTLYDDVALSSSTPPPTNPITNGTFETGSLSGWTTAGTATAANSGAHSGTYAAQLGGSAPTNGDSSASQTFTATGGGTLSFWYNVTCPDTVTYDWATATLKDNTANTTATVLAKTCVASSGWTQVSSALTAGHSYTLTLTSHDDNYAGDSTYTGFDDVTVS